MTRRLLHFKDLEPGKWAPVYEDDPGIVRPRPMIGLVFTKSMIDFIKTARKYRWRLRIDVSRDKVRMVAEKGRGKKKLTVRGAWLRREGSWRWNPSSGSIWYPKWGMRENTVSGLIGSLGRMKVHG